MKALLVAINAKYIHSNLAVYSLKACAGPYKEQVELAEFTINHQKDYILQEIYKQKPDILGISCYIWNIEYALDVSKEFHKLCPQVPIWVGGPEVSYETEELLQKNSHLTGIMVGEGEETFRDVMEYYMNPDNQKSLRDIPGLAYRESEENCKKAKIVITAPRAPMDMNRIPFCYNSLEDFSNRIIYYESSRGCPFSCSYCLSSVDKSLRFRDAELVKEELKFFMDRQVPQVKFVDRTFNCNHAHAMEIWQFIKEQDNGVTNFHFEISADLLTEEELELLSGMRPGLIQLEIGVQSTNEATIQEIHRTMKLDRLKEVVQRIQAGKNIHEHLDLIAGLPYEDYGTFANSFDEIYALKPNQLQLGFLKVLKGSYMYIHAKEYGICYHEKPPYEVLYTNWLSYTDLLRIKQVEEMLEVYYNSGQFEITILLLECLFDSAFEMFLRLGEFYEKKKYFSMNHSRLKRCEIVLEFLEEYLQGKEESYKENILFSIKEALIFDLYYRENCKSRPDWAPDPSRWKGMTRSYCVNGKLSHVEPFFYDFLDKDALCAKHMPKRREEPLWALFSYEKRDLLNHQAHVEYVKEKKDE